MEKACKTCKNSYVSFQYEPCYSCFPKLTKWEPKETPLLYSQIKGYFKERENMEKLDFVTINALKDKWLKVRENDSLGKPIKKMLCVCDRRTLPLFDGNANPPFICLSEIGTTGHYRARDIEGFWEEPKLQTAFFTFKRNGEIRVSVSAESKDAAIQFCKETGSVLVDWPAKLERIFEV